MDDTKNTNFTQNSYMNCTCKNGYTSSEMYMESFGKDDDSITKCNNCPAFTYSGGIAGCEKFN